MSSAIALGSVNNPTRARRRASVAGPVLALGGAAVGVGARFGLGI